MPLNYDEIIQAMDEHLNKSGKNYYNEFYIGITNSPERRLFERLNNIILIKECVEAMVVEMMIPYLYIAI